VLRVDVSSESMGPRAASSSSRGALASIAASGGLLVNGEVGKGEWGRTLLFGLVFLLIGCEEHVVGK